MGRADTKKTLKIRFSKGGKKFEISSKDGKTWSGKNIPDSLIGLINDIPKNQEYQISSYPESVFYGRCIIRTLADLGFEVESNLDDYKPEHPDDIVI